MKKLLILVLIGLSNGAIADPRITVVNYNQITWTNSVTSGYYRIEWTCDIDNSQSWYSTWSNLVNFGGVSTLTVQANVPCAYRVLHSTNAFSTEPEPGIQTNETRYALSHLGRGAFQNAEPGIYYAVDWMSGTNWLRSWNTLCNIAATGLQMSCTVPLYLRVSSLTESITNISGMAYVFGGCEQVGYPGASVAVDLDGFYIDLYEVTSGLWDDVALWAQTNGYDLVASNPGEATNYPKTNIAWEDAVKWCNARSEKEGLAPCYTNAAGTYTNGDFDGNCNWTAAGYRLPTEVQWECAARGTNASAYFPWGGTNDLAIAGSNANYRNSGDLSEGMPNLLVPVGGWTFLPDYLTNYVDAALPDDAYFFWSAYKVCNYAPNDYGLYDMAGNASEWCWDWYRFNRIGLQGSTNYTGPATGTRRAHRGGSAWLPGDKCTVYRRFYEKPDQPRENIGFRCVRARQ